MLIEAPLTSLRDRILLIRTLPSFDGTDMDAVAVLAEHSRIRAFRAGEAVLRAGEPATAIYIVLQGQITSRRHDSVVAVVTRPNGVGLISIFARDDQVSAIADVDTQTLEIPASVVLSVMEENFSMYRNRLAYAAMALVKKRGNLPARQSSKPVEIGALPERPRTVVEIAMAIRGNDGLFSRCNLDAVYDLARQSFEVIYEPGEVVWRIGEPSSWWLRIDYGRLRCTSADEASVDLGTGHVLGIMDALGQVPRSFVARAETRVVGYRTDLEPFLAILENHFELARDLLGIVSRSLLSTPEVQTQRPPPPPELGVTEPPP